MKNRYDMEKLKYNQHNAFRNLEENGIKVCFDENEQKLLKLIFTPIFLALRQEIFTSSISLVYTYRQSEQTEEFAAADGLCNISAEYRTVSIGISVEALHSDPDYATMVLIHEITHSLCKKGTDPDFFMRMDRLLFKYNRLTKSKIRNDYSEKGVRQIAFDNRSDMIRIIPDE